MKTLNSNKKQYGFLELGVGMALFALFGTTAIIITPDSQSELKSQVSCSEVAHSKIDEQCGVEKK